MFERDIFALVVSEKVPCFYTRIILFLSLFFFCNFRKDYIIDMCSVDRNHILVKTYLVGGASERIIPGMTLTEVIKSAPALSFGG